MSEKKIFINPQAPSVATALISGVAGNPTNFPELFFGDAYEFVVKFTGDSEDGFVVPPSESFVFNLGLLARASAGTFVLEFDGVQTAPLPFDASAEDVATALNALEPMQNVGGCEVTGLGGSPYRIIFKNYGGRSKIGIQSSLFPDVAPISYVVESGSPDARAEQLIILKLDYVASVTDYTIDANAKELRFKVSLNTVECLLALGQADKVKLIAELKGISATGDVQTFMQIPATIYNRLIDVSALEYTIVELAGVVAQANAILEQFRSESAGITESIKTLSQVKSNRGELWFGGGKLQIPNMSFVGVWSIAMRIKTNNYPARYTSLVQLSDKFYLYWNTRLAVLSSTYIANAKQVSVEADSRLTDGNLHSLAICYDGTTLRLFDETGEILAVATSGQINLSNLNLNIGDTFDGQIADVKMFNFDITSEDAPYTLADYINGKDESPLLKGGFTTNASEKKYAPASSATYPCTITTDDNNIITITTTADIASKFVWIDAGANSFVAPQNANVEIIYDSIDNGSSIQVYFNNASGRVYSSAKIEPKASLSFVASQNITRFSLLAHTDLSPIPVGTTITIKGLKIKVNGALLSLADYSIQRNSTTKVVLDESGNGNVAIITGNVVGTKDSAISAFIDELKMQITQTS